MKREEVKEIFPTATEEEIDSLLNKIGAELNPLKKELKETKDSLSTAQTDLQSARESGILFKQQLDEAQAKLDEGLSDEERIAAREAAAEQREKDFNLRLNGLDAKEIFVSAGCFDADEIDALVSQVTTDDAEATKNKAHVLVDMVTKQRQAVEAATRDALLKENPKPDGAGSEGGVPTTVTDFLKLPYNEQVALKEANPGLISQLKK